ncbi:hypothetical protein ACFFX0_04820 [Citricoccus parietis]|uniref:Uncharacterized protein n=1 Tax=Citricoccus parietis TaxID=592307 RepID=A0ABV5FV33_9MICC
MVLEAQGAQEGDLAGAGVLLEGLVSQGQPALGQIPQQLFGVPVNGEPDPGATGVLLAGQGGKQGEQWCSDGPGAIVEQHGEVIGQAAVGAESGAHELVLAPAPGAVEVGRDAGAVGAGRGAVE